MIINKKIKETLDEISKESIKNSNSPDKEHRYLRRMLKLFKENLTEEEQLYLFKVILEQIHYRSIISDPDNILQIHNIKLKTITYVFFLSIVFVITAAIMFESNENLNKIIEMFNNVFKILSL